MSSAPNINSSINSSMLDTKSLKESALIGAGVLALSFAGGKIAKDNLGVNLTMKGAAKLVAAIVASNYLLDMAKTKGYITL